MGAGAGQPWTREAAVDDGPDLAHTVATDRSYTRTVEVGFVDRAYRGRRRG